MKDILNLNESEKNRIRGLHGMQHINEESDDVKKVRELEALKKSGIAYPDEIKQLSSEIEENLAMGMSEKGEVEEVEQYLNEKGLKIDKGEGRMAKHDTMELVNDAKEVSDMIQDDMDLPEWVESKITIAAENLNTVRDYISHHILGIHK